MVPTKWQQTRRAVLVYLIETEADRQSMLNAKFRRAGINTLAVRAIRITYSEFVLLTFGIQHALRMRRIVLSSVACFTLRYSSAYNQVHGYVSRTDGRTKSHYEG